MERDDSQLVGFSEFVNKLAETDNTWKFWHGFIFHDGLVPSYSRWFLESKNG